MNSRLTHVQRGFGSVRPYLHGPIGLSAFLEKTFGVVILETNDGGPTFRRSATPDLGRGR